MYSWTSRLLEHFSQIQEIPHKVGKRSKAKTAVVCVTTDRLGYICNPRSLKEGMETSRRRTDELGSRLERPIYFECKLNEPMHIGMQLLRIGIPTKRPRILPLPVSRGGLLCRYFLAQVRAPIGRPVTVAMALPTQ